MAPRPDLLRKKRPIMKSMIKSQVLVILQMPNNNTQILGHTPYSTEVSWNISTNASSLPPSLRDPCYRISTIFSACLFCFVIAIVSLGIAIFSFSVHSLLITELWNVRHCGVVLFCTVLKCSLALCAAEPSIIFFLQHLHGCKFASYCWQKEKQNSYSHVHFYYSQN